MWSQTCQKQEEYQVPDWASGLKVKPTTRLKLANTPTPIQYWPIHGLPEGVSVFIKRDDMTGSTLGGNKVRKLEFLLSDAIAQGYSDVITAGNSQSNHVRTTMLAAKEVGLQSHCLCYMKEDIEFEDIVEDGNMFLTKMSGCHGYFALHDRVAFLRNREKVLDQAIDNIRKTTGRRCYKIPLGGSNVLGVFGYLDAYQELLEQGLTDHVTDVVITCGTGGSLAGLAIANYLANGDKIKIHGYSVGLELQDCFGLINTCLEGLGLDSVKAEDIVTITDSRGLGYAQNTVEELAFIQEISKNTGILLDTSYTGKTAYAMVNDIKSRPEKLKGKEILFVHTGGVYLNLTAEKLSEFGNASSLAESDQIWKVWKPDL